LPKFDYMWLKLSAIDFKRDWGVLSPHLAVRRYKDTKERDIFEFLVVYLETYASFRELILQGS